MALAALDIRHEALRLKQSSALTCLRHRRLDHMTDTSARESNIMDGLTQVEQSVYGYPCATPRENTSEGRRRRSVAPRAALTTGATAPGRALIRKGSPGVTGGGRIQRRARFTAWSVRLGAVM